MAELRSDWRYDRGFDWSYSCGRSGGRPGVVIGRAPEPENGGHLSLFAWFYERGGS